MALLFENLLKRSPGAERMRRIVPGLTSSNPAGALYHGSWLGSLGVEEVMLKALLIFLSAPNE